MKWDWKLGFVFAVIATDLTSEGISFGLVYSHATPPAFVQPLQHWRSDDNHEDGAAVRSWEANDGALRMMSGGMQRLPI